MFLVLKLLINSFELARIFLKNDYGIPLPQFNLVNEKSCFQPNKK